MDKDTALDLALEALEEACEIVGAAWTWRNEKGRPAITAIKQARSAPVPLTPEQRRNLWVSATIEPPSHENCYYRGIADSEAYHGITKGQP
jgi:hypothetical protein